MKRRRFRWGAGVIIASACAAIGSEYRISIFRTNPVGYWRLQELPGATIAADASTNQLAGIYHFNSVGSPALGQVGISSNSVVFSYGPGGASDYGYVSIPYNPILSPVNSDGVTGAPFSAECWLTAATASPSDYISPLAICGSVSGAPYANGSGWNFYEAPTTPATWQLCMRTESGLQSLVASAPVVANQWVHLCATFDGSFAKLYVNGEAQATNTLTNYVAVPIGTGGAIGAGLQTGHGPWEGAVDEVAIYAYALSAQQISNHFSIGSHWLSIQASAIAAAGAGKVRDANKLARSQR
jgi:hypothetical protein